MARCGRLAGLGMFATLIAAALPAGAQELAVDLELVLAIDVSGSMDVDERQVQRDGYVEALRHPEVVAAATGGGFAGRIALTIVEWGGPLSQAIIVPWMAIDGAAAAAEAAAILEAAPSPWIRGTSISSVLLFAGSLFDANGFAGTRQVIDVSGDGPNNMGPPVLPARDAVIARGITINGLPLTLKTTGFGAMAAGMLDLYYEDCVIGGPGAFYLPVQAPEHLADAIRRKLVLEIAGRPPATVAAGFVPTPFERTGLLPAQRAPRIDCMIGEKLRRDWMNDENR